MPCTSHSWAKPAADGKTRSGIPKWPKHQTFILRPMAVLWISSCRRFMVVLSQLRNF